MSALELLLRRRQMMHDAGALSNYVKDGLVLHLDGIQKGDYSTIWSSVVGNYSFSSVQGEIIKNDNNVEFDGNTVLRNTSFSTPNYEMATIEVVFKKESVGGVLYVGSRDEKEISAGIESGGMKTSSYSNSPTYPNTNEGSISISSERVLYNGTPQSSTGNGYITTGSAYNTIGGKYLGGNYTLFLTGKIYSIRIYNRILTEDEVFKNLATDRARFGIGY